MRFMKKEREFLKLIEKKAYEDRELISGGVLPYWAKFLGGWLGVNPWRAIVPLSIIVYLTLRVLLGESFVDGVLNLYGGYHGS